MKKANHDTYVAIAFLMFCAFAWWRISKLPLGVGYEHTIGPEFFPGVMTATIALLSLALLGRSLWYGALDAGEAPAMAAGNVLLRMALFIVLLVVYILIYEPLGFLVASAVILPAGMLLLGERRPLHIFVFPYVIIGLAYYGFTKIMMVPLPEFPSYLYF
ncbi:MAG: tripartite tricarboxylate transporter TctB family protein [Methylobacteriaceae bacterium]|jgi:putative tricarboxylic transport membrane protein|nr:tripartite tricarboxylate transporter TctB family protein [Methylobacteriaceae bacterium]